VCDIRAVNVEWLPFRGRLGYFLNAVPLRIRLAKLQPDILNAHYASGYGSTAALAGFRPSLLSVWGSDVFEFPNESWWKGMLLRYNLRRATRVGSTSHAMADRVRSVVQGLPPAIVTPFGVHCDQFRPDPCRDPELVTVGTVKTLGHLYGTDLLIDAFSRLVGDSQLREAQIAHRLRLLLVGGGDERAELEALTTKLGIRERCLFVGAVVHGNVPAWLNRLDIYVATSRSESFGVAAVEASACEIPVVVSDAGGLPEVVRHGETGFVVPRENAEALAGALKQLVLDEPLRRRMGRAGREFVLSTYEWDHCVSTMEAAYREVIAGYRT
jgi:glycosyltransferase involved in cell wall biosynthesis